MLYRLQFLAGLTGTCLAFALAFLTWNFRPLRNYIKRKAHHSAEDHGSENTIVLNILGFFVCIGVGCLVFTVGGGLVEKMVPRRLYPAMRFINPILASLLGLIVGKILFKLGKFSIPLGKGGYVSFLNLPIKLKVGTGSGWLPPPFKVSTENTAALRVPVPKEELLTGDGVKIFPETDAVYSTHDVAQVQLTAGESVSGIVTAEVLDALRTYVFSLSTGFSNNLLNVDEAQVPAILAQLASFKGAFKRDCGEIVRAMANEKTMKRGVKIEDIQIKDVSLDPQIEETLTKTVKEIAEKGQLALDIKNKERSVQLIVGSFRTLGIDLDALSDAQRAAIVEAAWERALAIEGNATRYSFAGEPPRGMMLNPNQGG